MLRPDRWHIQRGDRDFPKPATVAWIAKNADIFDVELTAGRMEMITALNRDERTGPDSDVCAG
jgi:2,5-diketo-D-gluconate reductase A